MSEIRDYEVSLEELTKQITQLQIEEKNLKAQQEALNKAKKAGKITEQQYTLALAQTETKIKANIKAQKTLEKSIKSQQKNVVDYGKKINGVGDALGKLGGLGVGGFGALGNAIKSLVGGPMGMLTLAIGAVTSMWKSMDEAIEEDRKKHEEYVATMTKQMQSELDFRVQMDQAHGASKYDAEMKVLNELRQKQAEQLKTLQGISKTEAYLHTSQRNRAKMLQDANDALKQTNMLINEFNERTQKSYQEKLISDAQKELDARKKAIEKAKEARKKAIEDEKKADEDAQRQLEELRVKMIKDDGERQKAQIELDKSRAIKALNDIAKRASANGKRAAQEAIKLIDEISKRDIVNVDIKEMQAKFGSYMTKLADVMKDEMTVSMRKLLSGVDSSTAEESLVSLEKHFNTMNASIEATLESYTKLNNKELAGTEEYTRHVEALMRIFRELDEANPMRDLVTAAEASGVKKLEVEELKRQKAIEDINKRILDEKEKLNKLYKDEQDSIVAITTAEVKRMDVAKEQNKAAKYDEFQQRKISYEQMLADTAAIDAEFTEKREILNQKTNEKLKLINDNYAASEVNIRKNAEDEKTLVTQQAAERRRQIIADEMQHHISWVNSVGDAFGALAQIQQDAADDESKSDRQREKARRKALNLQIAQTFTSMAAGLAEGIANAVSAGWPAMLATIPATVAMLIANFATVKSLLSKKSSGGYAEGGLVSGAGSGTSDSIPTNVSNGEYVVRASAVRDNLPMLDAMNYGNAGPLATQLAMAIQTLPNPVVSVQTIEQVQNFNRQVSAYSHL